jgi:Contractile injection system tube protein
MPPSTPSPATSLARVQLISLDVKYLKIDLVAQFNPAQLQLEDGATWTPAPNAKADLPHFEFTGGKGCSLSVELFFDTFENGRDVKRDYVDQLVKLVRVMKPGGTDEDGKRPPMVELRWGTGFPPFRGVIESVSTKLTMFRSDGTPVRATCALKLLECDAASFRRQAS